MGRRVPRPSPRGYAAVVLACCAAGLIPWAAPTKSARATPSHEPSDGAALSARADTTPPDTTLTSGPSGETNNPAPHFAFSSSEPGSTFQCRLDTHAYGPCVSPKAASKLADGPHVFRVRATDRAGNVDPTPASRTFTVRSAPNVLVVETDDQTVESMKVMRNVNSLIGDQGVTFANSFVNYSLCCPSRATFLTGQYAHNHGVLFNGPPDGGFERFEALHANDNLAVWLQDAGYYTGLVGKYLNLYANDPPRPPGWSEFHAALPDDQRVYDYRLSNNGAVTHYGEAPGDFKQDVLTDKAVGFVDRRAPQARPFFLWLTYTAPHIAGPEPNPNPPSDCASAPKPAPRDAHAFDSQPLPMQPDFNEADVSDKPAAIRNLPRLDAAKIADIRRKYRCQLESLLSVDEGVKEVIDALRAKGELGDTLIVYTSDNGYFNGEHRIPGTKNRVYEESIRVPLEMRGPGLPKGATVTPLVINADLAPTITQVASAARPGLVMDGRSLIPVANDPAIDANRRLLIEEPPRSQPSRPSFAALRTERYLYAEHNTGEVELYDLQTDPFELRSLHDDSAYAALKARLADELHELKSCAGSSCRAGSGGSRAR
jgi:N-acetylglucosamine-6-sulfatase